VTALRLSADERAAMLLALEDHQRVELHRRARPGDWYRPHLAGQRQFHQADHIIRALFPGNGFGKTTAAGTEVNWWATHSHPWLAIKSWPQLIVWCCETYKQFKLLRSQLETTCFDGEGLRFNKVDHTYTWPNGSMMFLVSGDSSWTHIQGINPDLVIFDEQPPHALWTEMQMRRRGLRKTKFVFAATATQGITYMHREIYLPWLGHHLAQGLTEGQAMRRQSHPTTWCWPRGGIDDNPGADEGDRAWYRGRKFNSEAEKLVRLGGGFRDFSGTPIFDLNRLEEQRQNLLDPPEAMTGGFELLPAPNPDDPRVVTRIEKGKTIKGLLAFKQGALDPRGRVTIFRAPVAGRRYVVGHDSALGLVTGDYDAAVVLDRESGEQVAEALGHWGDASWCEVLFGLGWYFNQAFMLGERQVGLPVMRRLYDEMGYAFQYYRRDDTKRSRPRHSDELGHHRFAGDPTIGSLRRALAPEGIGGRPLAPEITLRGRETHRQLGKFQFMSSRSTIEVQEARDSELVMGAPRGDHDDLVLALAYANKALGEVEKYQEKEIPYPQGSYGEVFKLHEVLHPGRKAEAPDPFKLE